MEFNVRDLKHIYLSMSPMRKEPPPVTHSPKKVTRINKPLGRVKHRI